MEVAQGAGSSAGGCRIMRAARTLPAEGTLQGAAVQCGMAHNTAGVCLGLLIVLVSTDLFRVWASLSLKAASVHRKARHYETGCLLAQKK